MKLVSILCFSFLGIQIAHADVEREIFEAEINANIDEVWNAFATSAGLQSWMAPLAEIDLQVGGLMRANYNPDGQLGGPGTIENTILAFDPGAMLALKATGFPEGFPYVEAAASTWSVFYFSAVSEKVTAIRIVGLGYTDSEDSVAMRIFFRAGNEQSLNMLKAALE